MPNRQAMFQAKRQQGACYRPNPTQGEDQANHRRGRLLLLCQDNNDQLAPDKTNAPAPISNVMVRMKGCCHTQRTPSAISARTLRRVGARSR